MANNPSLHQVHNINEPLTNFSLLQLQSDDNFVADGVFPVVPVAHQSSSYYSYERGAFNRHEVKERAPGTAVQYGGYNATLATYTTKVYATGDKIDSQVRANADSMVNLDYLSTAKLTKQMQIHKEIMFANSFFTNVWTTTLTGVSSGPSTNQFLQWNNSSATPVTDVRTAKRTIELASGGVGIPNTLVLGKVAYDTLLDNPQVEARVQYAVKQQGEAALVTKDILAQLFEVDRVLVGQAVQNTAVEGASESNSFILNPKAALLAYVPPAPGLNSVAAGLNFTWSEYGPSRITSYDWLPTRSTHIEIEAAFGYNLVSADLGGWFASAVA